MVKFSRMLAYIPYMDPMGYGKPNARSPSFGDGLYNMFI